MKLLRHILPRSLLNWLKSNMESVYSYVPKKYHQFDIEERNEFIAFFKKTYEQGIEDAAHRTTMPLNPIERKVANAWTFHKIDESYLDYWIRVVLKIPKIDDPIPFLLEHHYLIKIEEYYYPTEKILDIHKRSIKRPDKFTTGMVYLISGEVMLMEYNKYNQQWMDEKGDYHFDKNMIHWEF